MAKKKTIHKKNLWELLSIVVLTFAIGYVAGNFTNSCTADDCKADVLKTTENTKPKEPVTSQEGSYYYIGAEDAPILMTEYTDYQCPFCQRYYFNTFGQIKDAFIATGKVRYVVKDLAFDSHAKARPAAYAARCAGEQGKYWEMHEKLFTFQAQWTYSDDTEGNFASYAEDIELDADEFKTCYAAAPEKFAAQIDNDIQEATSKGIHGTPSFVINDQIVIGAQSFDTFNTTIEKEL